MRDFPSCFGENGVQIADSSSSAGGSKNATNMVTCVYRTHHLASNANAAHSSASNPDSTSSCLITVTWTRSLMGQGFSVAIDDCTNQSLCKVDIKPWLFSKRKGSKSLEVDTPADSTASATTTTTRVDVFWDLSAAKFAAGPEPLEGFYVAVVSQHRVLLLLGDLTKEAYRKTAATPSPTDALFVAKREHVFGKRVYCTRARFCDNAQLHDVSIECETIGVKDPYLEIRIDKKRVMQVKRLTWKFRGNQTILVDGLPVEVFWDVHNWLFGPPIGNAVFMFQTCVSADKLLTWSSTQLFKDAHLQGLGFSLVLYAWKNE